MATVNAASPSIARPHRPPTWVVVHSILIATKPLAIVALLVAWATVTSSCAKDKGGPVTPFIGTFAGLNGTVWETLYRVPLSGTVVSLSGLSMTTGADGHFFFSDVQAGNSTLTVQRPGYLTFSDVVALEGARTLDVVLKASTAPRLDGNWRGDWNTTTLGRSGGLTMSMAVDTVKGALQADFDINGNLVGVTDPPGDVFPGVIAATDTIHISRQSPVYGLVTADITADGRIVGNATRIPIGTATRLDFTGRISATTATVDYTIVFADGSVASGTATLAKP